MGGSQSSPGKTSEEIHNLLVNGGKCVGSSPHSVSGGADKKQTIKNLADYGNSRYSKDKEQMIRGIAEDLAGSLMTNAKGASIDDILKNIGSKIPKPSAGKQFTKEFNSSSKKQQELCLRLADSLNERYGMQVVDTTMPPYEICRQAAELTHSLARGVQVEFLSVAADVSRHITNLQVLQEYMRAANARYFEILRENGDDVSNIHAEQIQKYVKVMEKYINNQLAALSASVGRTIGPVGQDLNAMLEQSGDMQGMVMDFKGMTGTEQFADRLGRLLSGISTTAQATNLVHKALKDIGMTVSQYAEIDTMAKLRESVYDMISAKKPGSAELQKLMLSADVLYSNNFMKDEVVDKLIKKSGGAVMSTTERLSSPDLEHRTGLRRFKNTKSFATQLSNREKFKRNLLNDFGERVERATGKVIKAVNPVANAIGKSIKLSDDLTVFVRRFRDIKIDAISEGKESSLSGFTQTANGQFLRHEFLGRLLAFEKATAPLTQTNPSMFNPVLV